MTRLYGRRATLTLIDQQYTYVEGVASRGFDLAFKLEHTLAAEGNKAEISIYNLNESSRATLSKTKRPRVSLTAGYKDDEGLIFSGELTHVSHVLEDTGYNTKISAQDGIEARRGLVNATLPPGSSVAQAIELVAKSLKVNARTAIAQAATGKFDGAVARFFNGHCLSGYAHKLMSDLGGTFGFQWTVLHGELIILRPNDLLPDEAINLTRATGLIDTPRAIVDTKNKGRTLVGARSLLIPRITIGRKLVFERSSLFPGVYRIAKTVHTGDTSKTDWYVDVEATRV